MGIVKAIEATKDFFEKYLNKSASVIGVSQLEKGWRAEVETIEDSEYLRQRGLDDIVAIFQVELNEAGEVVSYFRKGLRERNQIDYELIEQE